MQFETRASKRSRREGAVSLALAVGIVVAFALTSFLPPSNGVAVSAQRESAAAEQILR
jgi:hypothetical protein